MIYLFHYSNLSLSLSLSLSLWMSTQKKRKVILTEAEIAAQKIKQAELKAEQEKKELETVDKILNDVIKPMFKDIEKLTARDLIKQFDYLKNEATEGDGLDAEVYAGEQGWDRTSLVLLAIKRTIRPEKHQLSLEEDEDDEEN